MAGLVIVSAPSGSGKSTIVNYLMKEHPEFRLAFSVSATSRPPRGQERDGVDYYFLSPEAFRSHIEAGDFLEYEEVYEGRFYGTLKSQVEEKLRAGWNVVFDVDVKGGINIKRYYGDQARLVCRLATPNCPIRQGASEEIPMKWRKLSNVWLKRSTR